MSAWRRIEFQFISEDFMKWVRFTKKVIEGQSVFLSLERMKKKKTGKMMHVKWRAALWHKHVRCTQQEQNQEND